MILNILGLLTRVLLALIALIICFLGGLFIDMKHWKAIAEEFRPTCVWIWGGW